MMLYNYIELTFSLAKDWHQGVDLHQHGHQRSGRHEDAQGAARDFPPASEGWLYIYTISIYSDLMGFYSDSIVY